MAQRYAPAAADAIETTLRKKPVAYNHRIGSRDTVRNGKSLAIGQYCRQRQVFRRAAIINIRSQSPAERLRACATERRMN